MQFYARGGRPVPDVTAQQMADVDRIAVEDVGLTLLQMMENAGRVLAATASELANGGDVLVLAGAGGNGGGGICAARHLANHGLDVAVVLDRDPAALEGAPARQLRVLRETDADVSSDDPDPDASVVVDALVGYGLAGPLRGRAVELARATDRASGRVLSLDLPSGLDATTGDRLGPAVAPDRTLTLALPKTGLTGLTDLWLADIGIPESLRARGSEWRAPVRRP